jgi:hypothetical protein
MARRYSRDNRGRFAGGGGGATARGGRLKTASGNKRKTQTMQAGGAKAAGTIKGKAKRDPSAAGKAGKGKAVKPAAPKAAKPAATAFLKAGGKPSPSAMAQGRIKQFTDMKKVTDTEIRKVRQQIKDARSNATTFGAVSGLRLRLLELQSQSKRHRDTIASAKALTQK